MFIPRISKPLDNNKYYIKSSAGFNPCILGNEKQRDKKLNVLPNCVGWVTGRFNEIGDYGKCKYNLNMNAKDIFTNAKKLGLKTGITPQVGAIIVWANSQYGHCAIVEEVISETEIIISQSGWNATAPMWRAKHYKGEDGNWCYGGDFTWMSGKYTFLGFVYNPAVKTGESVMKSTQIKIKYKGKTYIIKDNYIADGKNYPAIRELLGVLGYKIGYDALDKAVTIEE